MKFKGELHSRRMKGRMKFKCLIQTESSNLNPYDLVRRFEEFLK